jgi:tetratricopeptide (TPR) repeat protein
VRNSIATFLRDRAGRNDTVILFIAAHGVVDARGAYVVTFDSDLEDLRSTALPMAEVQRLLEEEFAHVGRVLLYVDICRAGTIGTIRRNAIGRFVEMLLAGQAAETFGLLASRPGEVSVEHERFGGGHGAFSYFLLRGLNGEADENRDGKVEAGELVEYVRAKVREATRNQQTPRETGTLPPSSVLVRELGRPGIQLADWKSLDALIAARRGAGAPEAGLSAADRLLVSLQDSGQQVILRYLRGEQAPQQRADFELGEQSFRAALELDPGAWAIQSRALFCRGRVRIFDKQYDDAIRILERAARIDPDGAYIRNALGIAYLERGQYERAAPAFRDAIRLAPHWVYPVHNLALTFGEQGDYSAAVGTYRRAMAMAPRAAYLPYNLGLLQQRLNRARDAETAFRQAIARAPGEADAYNALGLLKASAGRRKEAEELYRRALALDSRSAPARHNLALLLSGMPPRADEAVALWRENLADSPDFLPSRLGLAEFLGKQSRVSEAIREYEEVVRLRPDFIGARTALAKLYEQTGRTEEAAAQLREARRLSEEAKARGRSEERLR